MSSQPPEPKMRVNGRELMRIQGVYMYVINRSGQVGAIMGFHPMVVIVYEDAFDHEPVKGYLRVDRWIYPLARSFSPIYIWGPDRLIMPEPFSSLTEPMYVVVRIPFGMSQYQKASLWNLLDVNAHVCGKFASFTKNELLAMDKLFKLTELTPHERLVLDKAEDGVCPPGTEDLPSLRKHTMGHKLLAFESKEGKLSICFNASNKKALLNNLSKEAERCKPDNKGKCLPLSLQQVGSEYPSPVFPTEQSESNWLGTHPDLIVLPAVRGNLMRLYVLGPRDPQHINVSTVMEWIRVTELMFQAVAQVFREQVRLRREKEEHGVPPSFEGRRQRLFSGWGRAESLNGFGINKRTATKCNAAYISLNQIDPACELMLQNTLRLQDLEAAADVFDHAINRCNLELLVYSPDMSGVERSSPTRWLAPLVPRPLIVRYHALVSTFATLITISATVEGDLMYDKQTNYLERIYEDCEHHRPKLRPRNPLLDPQYPYPREPSPYMMV
ncbi:uncharacterized protein DEA37_0011902 [Paragonimus westermani]|uniref:Uncharacterized protein n=1 Tax=Paragonimus westermani TaxID=34504 RepID=A0A5J4P141_9TREM|nr:uncharacterized protein DEA37_0011902 [Paragonimus westermani]